jgi:hypothetical protein
LSGTRTSSADAALDLVRRTIDEFDDVRISATMRRALRAARMRGDWAAAWRFDMESVDLNKGDSVDRKAELGQHFGNEEAGRVHELLTDQYLRDRRIQKVNDDGSLGEELVTSWSVEQMEDMVADMKVQREHQVPPPGLHTLDLYYAEHRYDQRRVLLSTQIGQLEVVLSRLRRRVWDFLIRTEVEIAWGSSNAEVFDRYRQAVDSRLRGLAPRALEQLESSYRRLREGDAEARSQALLACRRILKTIADVLYPPRDAPAVDAEGTQHEVGDKDDLNRLWQFVSEQSGKSKSRQLMKVSITDTGNRVDALYDLASKGVHDEVSVEEVDQAVIQTYLLVGDLLRLAQETGALRPGEGV